MTVVLFDSVDPALFPDPTKVPFQATAGYVNGKYPSSAGIKARFPNLPHLSITVTSSVDADVLDIEPGNATPSAAPAWLDRQYARGLKKPVIYCGNGDIAEVRRLCGSRPFWWWSANWTRVAHIDTGADATQWNDKGPNGEGVDQTQMSDEFYRWIGGGMTPDQEKKLDELLNIARTARRDGDPKAWPYAYTPADATLTQVQAVASTVTALRAQVAALTDALAAVTAKLNRRLPD